MSREIDAGELAALAEEIYEALVPILKGRPGELAFRAIHLAAAQATYGGIGGVAVGPVQIRAPKSAPIGLIGEIAAGTVNETLHILRLRLKPGGENGN